MLKGGDGEEAAQAPLPPRGQAPPLVATRAPPPQGEVEYNPRLTFNDFVLEGDPVRPDQEEPPEEPPQQRRAGSARSGSLRLAASMGFAPAAGGSSSGGQAVAPTHTWRLSTTSDGSKGAAQGASAGGSGDYPADGRLGIAGQQSSRRDSREAVAPSFQPPVSPPGYQAPPAYQAQPGYGYGAMQPLPAGGMREDPEEARETLAARLAAMNAALAGVQAGRRSSDGSY